MNLYLKLLLNNKIELKNSFNKINLHDEIVVVDVNDGESGLAP